MLHTDDEIDLRSKGKSQTLVTHELVQFNFFDDAKLSSKLSMKINSTWARAEGCKSLPHGYFLLP